MKIIITFILIFFSKFALALTWEESREGTLKFLRQITDISAALHVCEEYDLSIQALGIVNETIEIYLKQDVISTSIAIDLKELTTLHNVDTIKEISSKGISSENCKIAKNALKNYANQRQDANKKLNSLADITFDLNLVKITPMYRDDCISFNIKNESKNYLSHIKFYFTFIDADGKMENYENVTFLNTSGVNPIPPNVITKHNSCSYSFKLKQHVNYLQDNYLIYGDDLKYIEQYIDYKIVGISVDGTYTEKFLNQDKPSTSNKRKTWLDKIKITPQYEKKCVFAQIKNGLEDEILTRLFYIIFKDSEGVMEDFEAVNFLSMYKIPPNFTITTSCLKSNKYEYYVKKLKKSKLINKKLNNIQKYIEIKIGELDVASTNIELNLLAKD